MYGMIGGKTARSVSVVAKFEEYGVGLYADVTYAGSFCVLGSRYRLSGRDGSFAFYVLFGEEEYLFAGTPLRKLRRADDDAVFVEPEHVLESLGEEAAGSAAALALTNDQLGAASGRANGAVPLFYAWARLYSALPVSRQVSLAVADSRLARHMSADAAAAYAEEHQELAQSGHLL